MKNIRITHKDTGTLLAHCWQRAPSDGASLPLLPLAVLEIYLRVQDRADMPGRVAMAAGRFGLTVLTGVGIFAATIGLWLPRL